MQELSALEYELYKYYIVCFTKVNKIRIYKVSSLKYFGNDEVGFLKDDSKII